MAITENKNSGTENITKVQLLQTEKIGEMLKNIKKVKSQFESIVQLLADKQEKFMTPVAKEQPKKVEAPIENKVEKVEPVQKPAEAKPEATATKQQVRPSFENSRTRQFDTNDQQRRPFVPRSDRPAGQGGFAPRGDRPYPPRNGDRPYPPRTGDRPYPPRTGDRPFPPRGDRPAYGPRPAGSMPGAYKRPFDKPAAPDIDLPLNQKTSKNTQVKKRDNHSAFEEKRVMNKKALLMRGFVEDGSLDEDGERMGSRRKQRKVKESPVFVAPKIEHAVITTEHITVKLLAEKIGKPVSEIMSKFLILGMMVNINSTIDFASAELIAGELGVTIEQKVDKTFEEKLTDIHDNEVDNEADLVKRPPVVTVLGHVDHGKTSLLDALRNTNVTKGEAGGITQHIGAYTIQMNGEPITFIDTPGHAAFTAMRERGANLTDIAILVVAADDGVMPQTIEAIKFIKNAKVPMIVAINKIDKPTANVERIKQQLTENDVVPEEWGGDAILVPISATAGTNLDKLLEMVLFVAEYQNLKANPKRKAKGAVVEAQLDKGKGTIATVLVQNGTLKVGDVVVAGTATGKVRAMLNDKGKNVKTASPSFAVSILGLSSVPKAGDLFYVVDEKMSKQVISERKSLEKTNKVAVADMSLDALMDKFKEVEYKDLNVIVKGDVQGSVEALTASLSTLMNEEVKVKCIHGGVGAINENDVMLAQASNAILVAFAVKTDFKAKILAEKYKVNILNSKIIYEVIDFVTKKMNSMVTPKYKEVISGHADVRITFKASKLGVIAGSYVLDGKIIKNAKARITRDGKQIYDGTISSLQREKNDAKEVNAGYECGIMFAGYNDILVGDQVECYVMERIN